MQSQPWLLLLVYIAVGYANPKASGHGTGANPFDLVVKNGTSDELWSAGLGPVIPGCRYLPAERRPAGRRRRYTMGVTGPCQSGDVTYMILARLQITSILEINEHNSEFVFITQEIWHWNDPLQAQALSEGKLQSLWSPSIDAEYQIEPPKVISKQLYAWAAKHVVPEYTNRTGSTYLKTNMAVNVVTRWRTQAKGIHAKESATPWNTVWFPFETLKMSISLISSTPMQYAYETYMSDNFRKPDEQNDLDPTMLDKLLGPDWTAQESLTWTVTDFAEYPAPFQQSFIGVKTQFTISRNFEGIVLGTILPVAICISIAYMSLLLPNSNAMAMPKVGSTLLALVTMSNSLISIKSVAPLGCSWLSSAALSGFIMVFMICVNHNIIFVYSNTDRANEAAAFSYAAKVATLINMVMSFTLFPTIVCVVNGQMSEFLTMVILLVCMCSGQGLYMWNAVNRAVHPKEEAIEDGRGVAVEMNVVGIGMAAEDSKEIDMEKKLQQLDPTLSHLHAALTAAGIEPSSVSELASLSAEILIREVGMTVGEAVKLKTALQKEKKA